MRRKLVTNSLLFRTLTFDFVLVLFSICAITGFSLVTVRLIFMREMQLRGLSVLSVLSRDAGLPLLLNNRMELQEIAGRMKQYEDVLGVSIVPREGEPITSGRANTGRAGAADSVSFREPVYSEGASNILEWGDHTGGRAMLGEVQVTLSLRQQQDHLRRITLYSLAMAGLIVLLAYGAQYFRLRILLRPLERLVEAAGRIENGERTGAEECDSVFEFHRLTVAFNRMVSSLTATMAQLRESEERYSLAVEGSHDGIWDMDLANGRLYLSARWKAMLGYAGHELGDSPSAWFDRVHPGDIARLKGLLETHCAGRNEVFECEYRCIDKSGAVRWMRCRGRAVYGRGGMATRAAGSQADITESMAFDPLTRLPNRLLFLERLNGALARPESGGGIVVLFADVDGFKLINNSLGHLAGDELLCAIGARLKEAATAASRAGKFADYTLARLGGDEFAFFLEQTVAGTAALGTGLREAMREPFVIEGRSLFVTLSVGAAASAAGTTSGESLLRNADTAMYCAKAAGPNQFRVFEDSMRENALERLHLEAELRRALINEEFVLLYQPKVRLRDGRTTDLEALIRWNHPVRGLLSPAHFIPFAEETGLIERIGEWVLREACRQGAIWHRLYPGHAVSVSVNASPHQLSHDGLLQVVRGALAESGMPARSLNIEVTESAVMERPEQALAVLKGLHEMGIGIHLDDFGTGHSSLHCLRRYPFDTLKVDRSFVAHIDQDLESVEIVRAIVALGSALRLTVVAEGLERKEQVERVAALGCDYGQGFYFSRPVSAAAAGEIVARGIEGLALHSVPDIGPQFASLQAALEFEDRRE